MDVDARRPAWPLLQTMCLCYATLDHTEAMAITTGIPSLVHVILHMCESLSTLFSELVPGKQENEDMEREEDTTGESATESRRSEFLCWPLLQTISLSAIATQDVQFLCDVVRDRIARGTPISLILSSEAANVIPRNTLDWLQQNIEVRICSIGVSDFVATAIFAHWATRKDALIGDNLKI